MWLRAARLFVIILAFFFASTSAPSAQPKLDDVVYEADGWIVGYNSAYAGCSAYTRYTDGTILHIGHSQKYDYFIELLNESWASLIVGEKYKLTFRAGRRSWTGDFIAIERDGVKGLGQASLKEAFVQELSDAADTVVFAGSRRIVALNLNGSDTAVDNIRSCRTKYWQRAKSDSANNQPGGRGSKGISSGTGFVVSAAGHIFTNHHVIEGCKNYEVTRPGLASQTASYIASDAKNDLALLKIGSSTEAIPPLRLSPPRLGENVFVFGFPLGEVLASSGNFTSGSVTALAGVKDDTGQLQLSAPVQPGNSGGPLLDRYGNVIGVIVSQLRVGQNINFAIKASVARTFLELNGVTPNVPERVTPKEPTDIAVWATRVSVHVKCN